MEKYVRIVSSETGIDYIINVVFLLTGLYGLLGSLEFTTSAQLWPRNVSIFLIVAGTILLFRNYLPRALKPLVRDESLFGGDEQVEEDVTESIEGSTETPPAVDAGDADAAGPTEPVAETASVEMTDEEPVAMNVGRYPIDNSVFTAVTMLAYIFVGWLAGLLWTTPVFIAFYCWWFQKRWLLTIVLALAGFAIAFAFYDLLFLRIDEGVLTELVMG